MANMDLDHKKLSKENICNISKCNNLTMQKIHIISLFFMSKIICIRIEHSIFVLKSMNFGGIPTSYYHSKNTLYETVDWENYKFKWKFNRIVSELLVLDVIYYVLLSWAIYLIFPFLSLAMSSIYHPKSY